MQPIFLKDVTAYPGDQTQSINAAPHSALSRKSSLFTSSNVESEGASSGGEAKGTENVFFSFTKFQSGNIF